MEFLKEALGDELYNQVAEKLKDSGVKLADLSGGAYVGKEKYDAIDSQLKAAQDTLKGLGGKTVEQVNQEVADWRKKAEDAEQNANAKIAAMEFDAALSTALSAAKAKNPKAVAALLNREGLKLVDGSLIGLKEQLDAVRKENAYMFEPVQAESVGFAGKQPPGAIDSTSGIMNTFLKGGPTYGS